MDKQHKGERLYNDKEYLMMREEILQYLREYQTVRNMMYLVTATTMGFAITNTIPYLFLLPLMVILPSYIIATDYWKCVTKASTYLIVFYEQEDNSIFHWESRLTELNKNYKFMTQMNYQHVPYFVCGAMCFVLYFFNTDFNLLSILIGVVALIISIWIYLHYRKVDESAFLREWKKIKQNEELNKEAKAV